MYNDVGIGFVVMVVKVVIFKIYFLVLIES